MNDRIFDSYIETSPLTAGGSGTDPWAGATPIDPWD